MINHFKLKKFNFLLILICLFFLMNKTDFIKDFYKVIKFNEPSRIVDRYGFCGGESVGYLKYLKKKFNFKSNPKIINFIHTPPTNWSIYDSKKDNFKSDFEILINYPGKEIARLVQNKWDDNFVNEIKIVIGDEWSAGNLSYHLYSRPIWINDLKNKTSNITEDQGVIYTGNPKILKKICPGVFGIIKPNGYCMIGKR